MKGTNQETFQELHNDAQEYCLSSGPLNSKARTFPAALLNGLELVAAALAAMALTSSMLRFFIVSSPLSVMGSSMEIRVNVHNMPEDEQLRYVLSPAHDPQEVLEEGVLREGLQDLRFQGLDGNSPYILYYYLGGELADDYSFVTGPENQLEPVPAPSGSLTPSPEPTPSLEPTPSATPTPTPSPTPTPTPTPAPTAPPYVPPAPDPPEVKPPEPAAEQPGVIGANVENVDGIDFVRFQEQHTFTNIPSADYELTVVTNDVQLEREEVASSYNADTQTVTVTFWGKQFRLEQASASIVTLQCGESQVSSYQDLNAPGINSIHLNATPVLPVDGPLSCVFEFTVDWTSPSLGTVEFTLNLNMNSTGFPGYNDEPIPLSFPNPELPLSGNYTALLMEYPPESLVATLDVALTWDYGSGTLTLTDQASQSYGTM